MKETRRQSQLSDKVTLVAICDPHLSPRSPAAYKTNYHELTVATLRKVFDYAHKENADAIIWAGDIFHLKAAQNNPHWFTAEVLNLIKEGSKHGTPQLTIAGNHDLKFGSLEGLKGQPLDTILAAGAMTLLDEHQYLIHSRGLKVRIAGASYHHGRADTFMKLKKNKGEHLVSVGHFWFGSMTGELFGEKIYGPDHLMKAEADTLIIGHHHEDQGVQKIGGQLYVSPGSISRTGSHKHDTQRRPAAAVITITPQGATGKSLRPKLPPVDEIMDLEKKAQIEEEENALEEFIQQMQAAGQKATSPESILDELNPEQEVRTRARQYLQDAEQDTQHGS